MGHHMKKQNMEYKRQMQDAEIRERLEHINNKILVMSGKGGVGKSSIAAYLSLLACRKGIQRRPYG